MRSVVRSIVLVVCALAALCSITFDLVVPAPPSDTAVTSAQPSKLSQNTVQLIAATSATTKKATVRATEKQTIAQTTLPPDPYAELGIPAQADQTVYTQQVKAFMLEQKLEYTAMQALLDSGRTFEQITSMTHEERMIESFVFANPRPGGTPEDLLEVLPKQFAQLTVQYPLIVSREQYGSSVQGRSLDAYILANCAQPERTIILTFAIHGYEGLKANDGVYLTESACRLIRFYCQNPTFLGTTQLIICPMLNPDGVFKPAASGYGREQSQGVDMNRDFRKDMFKAQESQAFRDFLLANKPEILIDFHGWLNGTYGDAQLAEVFRHHTGLEHTDPNYGSQMGYLMGYAYKQGIRSLLVEHVHYNKIDLGGMIGAVNELCADAA